MTPLGSILCACTHQRPAHINSGVCLEPGCDCETFVSATKVGVPRMWDERAKRADRQWAAQAVWATLDSPRRAAVLLAVGERLADLQMQLSDWVPESITLLTTEGCSQGAQALEVSFTVVLPVMTQAEVDGLTEDERARLAVIKELAELARQLAPR